jgi:nucleotide-binding universal stress UspA family protein
MRSNTAGAVSTCKIVVGVDGSASSAQALRWAVRQARLTRAAVEAVYVWDVPNAFGHTPVVNLDWEQDARSRMERAINQALRPADQQLVSRRLVRGHCAEMILLDAAADAELLVGGSRGRGGVAGMLLGSVSQYAVTHARCPVVVIHENNQAVSHPAARDSEGALVR